MSDAEAVSAVRGRLTSSSESPELLYHYTNAKNGASILRHHEIWLTSYAKTGDPREIHGWVYKGIEAMKDEYPDAAEDFDRILRRSVRLACFTVDREPAPEAAVFSHFHRGWASASMWDRYGGGRAGVCLVFDHDKISGALDAEAQSEAADANETGELRDPVDSSTYAVGMVKYLDQVAVVALDGKIDPRVALASAKFRRDRTDHLYMVKNRDWAGEREYRLVASRPDLADDENLKLDIAGSLVAAVVGERFLGPRPAGADDVPVFRCIWSDGAPDLAGFTELASRDSAA